MLGVYGKVVSLKMTAEQVKSSAVLDMCTYVAPAAFIRNAAASLADIIRTNAAAPLDTKEAVKAMQLDLALKNRPLTGAGIKIGVQQAS